MTDIIADWITRLRWLLLALGAALAILCYGPSRSLDFDRSVENMFAPDDPLLVPYRKLKQTFGGNEIVLAVYRDPNLLADDRRGIERLYAISDELSQTPGVRGVLSLAELDSSIKRMAPAAALFGLRSVPERGIVEPDNELAERFLTLFEGYTHGADGQTAAIVCMLKPLPDAAEPPPAEAESPPAEGESLPAEGESLPAEGESLPAEGESLPTAGVPRQETIDQLREKMQRLAGGQVTGEPVMLADGFRYIEEDAQRLNWSVTILLSITILLCFRSIRWVLIAIGVVQLSLLLTRGILVLSGLRLSMVSSMLTAIVTVVGIATVVHIIVRFREGRRQGLEPREAFVRTVRLLAVPIFWACTTDAVGFAALMVAKVGPVRDFGLMMAIGAMMVLVSVVLLVPALALAGWHPPGPDRVLRGERLLAHRLSDVLGWVERHPWAVTAAVLVSFSVTAAGAYWLEIETDFTKNFRANSPIVQAYNTVETNLGGAGVWDVVLPAPATLNWSYLLRVFKLEQRLREEVAAEGQGGNPAAAEVPSLKVLSLGDALVAGAPSLVRTRSPALRTVTLTAAIAAMTDHLPVIAKSLHARAPEATDPSDPSDPTDPTDPSTPSTSSTRSTPSTPPHSGAAAPAYYRIMLRAHERQPAEQKHHLINQVTRISQEEFPNAEVTGFFVLLTNLISSIIRDQWLAFGVALAGIALAMLLAFLRPVYALIALVPNAFPILVVTGLMGWLGLKINMGAAMIAAVSMGLSVDSSIHYITSFQRARRAGKPVMAALEEVQHSVGLAVVFSTLALIVGFSVLATSQFVPTIYFGGLVSLTMLGGLLGNLVVLPLLLGWVRRS